MTILACVDEPVFRLIVCGTPSPEWLRWLREFDGPLSASQLVWKQLGEQREAGELPRLPEQAVAALGLPNDPRPASPVGVRPRKPRACPHRDVCDQCGQCQRCDCFDCET